MTREEARKLLSGYAAGSLSELERQILFDAALEDQELFDELAEEQAVKDLIELPGARQRLIAALEPAPRSRAWWPWAVGLAGVASVAIAVLVMRAPETTAPLEIAQNEVAQNRLPAAEAPREAEPAATVAVEPPVLPEAPAPKLESAPPVAADTELQAAQAARAEALGERREARGSPLAQPATLTPPPAPVAAPRALAPSAFLTDAGASKEDGFRVAASPELTYEVRDTGILRVLPGAAGFLEVTFDGRPLFPAQAVQAGVEIDISIPLEAQRLRIDFAANAAAATVEATAREETSGVLRLPGLPNARAAVSIPAQ